MSRVAPKPIIAEVLRTWRVSPGMIYSLVADIERNVWIVETCPAGTQFWTLHQAAQLPQGSRTRAALQEALQEGRLLERETRVAQEYSRRVASEEKQGASARVESRRPFVRA